ncbi:MAG: hypothetical protein KIT32_12085 [Rhodocyclaceae bacterium]|nr:hypothetical protein [Rhodocyclaceae bacterium]
MGIDRNGQPLGRDWGERAVYWLRQRFTNWPMKAIARELGESESVVKTWWAEEARPDRRKLQKLSDRYAKDGFTSFVFGRPSKKELSARLDALNDNIKELKALLNAMDQEAARVRTDMDR